MRVDPPPHLSKPESESKKQPVEGMYIPLEPV
jgi:hypothetical protein